MEKEGEEKEEKEEEGGKGNRYCLLSPIIIDIRLPSLLPHCDQQC